MSETGRPNTARQRSDDPAFISWDATSWRDAVEVAECMHGWLFRGQQDRGWGLETSLERAANTYQCPVDTLQEQEQEILNQFKRQAGHYLPNLPDDRHNGGGDLEWLSLIQHHGGPTRLLDFTRSFYVASFFAMETATNTATIWAVNQSVLERKFIDRADLYPEGDHRPTREGVKVRCVERCVRRNQGQIFDNPVQDNQEPNPAIDGPNVIAVKPWRLNQRLIIQQGWFMFPTSLHTTFAHNLCSALGVPGEHIPGKTEIPDSGDLKQMLADPLSPLALLRINFPIETHLSAMRDLQKMNITAATLFPGLDGFARSLKFPLRYFQDLAREDER